MTNAATEHAPDLETSRLRTGRYVERLSAAFSGAVRNDDPDGATAVVEVRVQAVTKGLLGPVGALPLGMKLGQAATGMAQDLKRSVETV